MSLLSFLDRRLRAWHVVAANTLALLWFIGITVASRMALPNVALFRCPIGFCAGGYSPEDLYSILDEIGDEGRAFLHDTLLRADRVLPALLLVALVLTIAWFTGPGRKTAIVLKPGARYVLLAVPVLYCIADYMENSAIAEILRLYPDVEDVMADKASVLTAAKSQLVAASLGIGAAVAIAAWGSGARSDPKDPLNLL
jgi:hypothetical protein